MFLAPVQLTNYVDLNRSNHLMLACLSCLGEQAATQWHEIFLGKRPPPPGRLPTMEPCESERRRAPREAPGRMAAQSRAGGQISAKTAKAEKSIH